MTEASWLTILGIVAPIILAIVLDGIRTRTKMAVIESRQSDDRADLHELKARMYRHETSRLHIQRQTR